MLSSSLLPADHLDLLISAAQAWDVTINAASLTTSEAFSTPTGLSGARADELGELLQQQNVDALSFLARAGQTSLVESRPRPYRHLPVRPDLLDPVEVLKACQAYEHSCAASPGWASSRARRFIGGLTTAAVRRLPGFATAPWTWTRPASRTGPAIGAAGSWRPAVEHLEWREIDTLVQDWSSARLVVLTLEALSVLPASLERRPDVFVLTRHEISDEAWPALLDLQPEAVLFYPACRPWLDARLRVDLEQQDSRTR